MNVVGDLGKGMAGFDVNRFVSALKRAAYLIVESIEPSRPGPL